MAIRRTRPRPERRGEAAAPEAIRAAALAHLARRDFASGELTDKLLAHFQDREAVTAVIAELREDGSLNDQRFVENFVRLHANRGQGPQRIRQELRQLGLPQTLLEEALAAGADWAALAGEVRRRKFGTEPPVDWAEKARQGRFLQYRGFSTDHIRLALGRDLEP